MESWRPSQLGKTCSHLLPVICGGESNKTSKASDSTQYDAAECAYIVSNALLCFYVYVQCCEIHVTKLCNCNYKINIIVISYS